MNLHLFAKDIILLAVLWNLAGTGISAPRPELSDTAANSIALGSPCASPAYRAANHDIGQLIMSTTNYGIFGSNGLLVGSRLDWFTKDSIVACEFPKDSDVSYMYSGCIWIGAVVGSDTLVSIGCDGWQYNRELHPDQAPVGGMTKRSILDPRVSGYELAISEQDYSGVCTDTFASGVTGLENDVIDNRPHIPLRVELTQRSYAWSVPSAEDFIIMDCAVRNIGISSLSQVYIGILIDGDVFEQEWTNTGAVDDLAGFTKLSVLGPTCPPSADSIPVAWIIDNDGDLAAGHACRGITGVALLRVPGGHSSVSFNWWVSHYNPSLDYGPFQNRNARDFQTRGFGTPEGDRNKYFVMKNGEIDPNQIFTATLHEIDTSFVAPASQTTANDIANGADTKYLLSFGPISLAPSEEAPFTFAYVAGDSLHVDPNNIVNLPANPDVYLAGLDFTDFYRNIHWAHYLCDRPWLDTDSDGYYGSTVTCWGNEMWLTGDGVPDFMPLGTGPHCCLGYRGNVDGSLDDMVDLSDLSRLVAYLTSPKYSVYLPCPDEANSNGAGIIDLADLTFLIAFLTFDPGSIELLFCP